MTLFQALALALLQGVSELFPVSSLGHTILVPALLHWQNIERSSPSFLAFVVVLHRHRAGIDRILSRAVVCDRGRAGPQRREGTLE